MSQLLDDLERMDKVIRNTYQPHYSSHSGIAVYRSFETDEEKAENNFDNIFEKCVEDNDKKSRKKSRKKIRKNK